jgi:prolyl 4-hydroxylase
MGTFAVQQQAGETWALSELDDQNRIAVELNTLALAVRQGSVDALHTLGIRLLLGDRAPLRPEDGIGMLKEATNRGHAEAPAILSVLHALGVHVQQGWQIALELMALSADRGNPLSREQITILAGVPGDSPQTSKALLSRINLDEWVSLPEAVTLSEDPLIRSFPDFATPEICGWLIRRSRNRLKPAAVYDAVSRQVTYHSTRTNSVAIYNLVETDLLQLLVQGRMAVCTGLPFRNFEASSVLHYEVGQAIRNHFDFIDPESPNYEEQIRTQGQRVITFLLYLNDDYAGGETAFPELGISHKGKAGEGMFFVNALQDGSPDVRTLHAGQPPTRGEKWIVSQFIRNCRVF